MEDTGAPFFVPYAEGTDAADAPAMTKPIAEKIHELLGELDPDQITGGAAGNLLVVQDTGSAAFKAMSGDVTIDKTGKSTIGALKVVTAMLVDLAVTSAKLDNLAVLESKIANLAVTAAKLANDAVETAKIKDLAVAETKINTNAVSEGKIAPLAVTAAKIANATITAAKIANNEIEAKHIVESAIVEAKLADGAVTSRKLKQTGGVIQATGTLVLTNLFQTIPGMELNITPAVASRLDITFILGYKIVEKAIAAEAVMHLDGEDLMNAVIIEEPQSLAKGHGAEVTTIPLSAEAHLIKMRAKKFPNEGKAEALSGMCKFMYHLRAE